MNDVFEDFPLCLSRLRNQDSVCEDTDLILGFAKWVKDPLWPQL